MIVSISASIAEVGFTQQDSRDVHGASSRTLQEPGLLSAVGKVSLRLRVFAKRLVQPDNFEVK